MWCVAKLDEEYIARMEDVLKLYEQPLDEHAPGGVHRPRSRWCCARIRGLRHRCNRDKLRGGILRVLRHLAQGGPALHQVTPTLSSPEFARAHRCGNGLQSTTRPNTGAG
jgi:hypothetical protein